MSCIQSSAQGFQMSLMLEKESVYRGRKKVHVCTAFENTVSSNI